MAERKKHCLTIAMCPNDDFRILILDDDYISRAKLRALLSPYGTCEEAATGEEALTRVKRSMEERRPYSLVTVDLVMPEIDGYDVIRSIRYLENRFHWERRTPVLVAAASPLAGDFMRSFVDGCDWYITKPFNARKVMGALSTLKLIPATA